MAKNIKAIAKDGSPYWVNANIIPILDESGENIQFLSIDSDITARELTKQNLRNIENALDYSSVVAITNAKGVITYVNEKFCALSQYTSEELIGKTHRIVNSEVHPKSFFKEMWNTIRTRRHLARRCLQPCEGWLPLLGQHNDRPIS